MTVALLDVNVLVALAWPSHVHHEAAHRWFGRNSGGGWATCAVTQLGFVRVSSNPSIIPEAVSPAEAFAALRMTIAHPSHVFWSEAVSPASDEYGVFAPVGGHRQLTDAYLLSLAIHMGGRLATLDSGIRNLVPTGRDPRTVLALIDT